MTEDEQLKEIAVDLIVNDAPDPVSASEMLFESWRGYAAFPPDEQERLYLRVLELADAAEITVTWP